METKELSLVWELCVKKDWYDLHTGTKWVMNYDYMIDLFGWLKDKNKTKQQFFQEFFDKQMESVKEMINEESFVKIHLEIKEDD